MATRVNTEEAPPVHAKAPPVRNLHNRAPVKPSGWVNVWTKMCMGAKNVATTMSATAKFTRRKFIGVLQNIYIKLNAP